MTILFEYSITDNNDISSTYALTLEIQIRVILRINNIFYIPFVMFDLIAGDRLPLTPWHNVETFLGKYKFPVKLVPVPDCRLMLQVFLMIKKRHNFLNYCSVCISKVRVFFEF